MSSLSKQPISPPDNALLTAQLELSHELTCILDLEFRIQYAFGSWQAAIDHAAADLPGENLLNLVDPQDRDLMIQTFREAQNNSPKLDVMARFKGPQLTPSVILWNIKFDSSRQVFIASGKDVTAKMQSRALVEQFEKITGVGSWEIDLVHQKLYWSDQTYAIHELTPDPGNRPVLAKGIEFYPGLSGEIITEVVNNLISTGQSFDVTLEFKTAKGRDRWVRSVGRAELRDGKVIRCYGTFQDVTEQRADEQQLVETLNEAKSTRQRLETAIQAVQFGVWDWNLKTNQLVWDAFMYDLFEIRREDFTGDFDAFQKTLVPEDGARVQEELNQCFARRDQNFRSEFRITTSAGKIKIIAAAARCFYDESGTIERLVGNNWDVTEQRETEAQLRITNQRLKVVLEGARLGTWDWDLTTNQVHFDKRWCELIGLDFKTVAHELTTWDARVHPADKAKAYEDIHKHINGETEFYENIHRMRHSEGHWVWILDLGQVTDRDAQGKPTRFSGVHIDVSSQKNSEIELAKTKHEIERFFHLTKDLICVINQNGEFSRINPAFIEMIGRDESKLSGYTVFDLIHPEDLRTTRLELARVSSGIDSLQFENRLLFDGDEYRSVSWSISQDTESGLIFCAIRDQTEKKRNELRLLQSAKMASLGEMAGGIAHEINNPLAIIFGRAERLLKKIATPPIDTKIFNDDLEKIRSTAERIAKIVRGLRSFSRDSSKDPFVKVDLAQIIEEAVALCRERFRIHAVELAIDCPAHVMIECQPVQLSQVLLNLLNNAHDAVEKLPEKWIRLDVRLFEDQNRVQISVTDSGHGIPEDIVKKITQPFFTTKEVGKGTGLGLSISKGLVEDHGGRLEYDSTCDHTCFIVDLPIRQSASVTDVA